MNEKFVQELLQLNGDQITRKLEERRAELLDRIEDEMNPVDVDELKSILGELFDINVALGESVDPQDGRDE